MGNHESSTLGASAISLGVLYITTKLEERKINREKLAILPTSGEHAYDINLSEENLIGEGSYGNVYKIHKKDEGKVYAAKLLKVPLKFMNDVEKLSYERELQILRATNHPFIIKFKE